MNFIKKFVDKFNINNYEIEFLFLVLKDFMPLSSNEKKWFSIILLSNRCNTVDEYKKLLSQVRSFPSKNNNKEWMLLLYGNDDVWDQYILNRSNKFKNTKNKNFSINKQVERISKNVLNEISSNIDIKIINNIISYFYPLSPMERKWIVMMFENFNMNEYQYINHFKKIREYDGIKSENYNWLSLLYGETVALKKIEEKSCRVKGEKNYFHNHGGTYSIWSDKSIIKLSDTRKDEIRKTLSSKRANDPKNVFLQIHYKSKDEYIKFQRKDLQYYINKYGEEIGIEKYNKKKLIWSYSRKGKLDNLENSIIKYGNDKCLIYILKISDNVIKVGITTKTVKERYGSRSYEILNTFDSSLQKCLELELIIKEKYYKFGIDESDCIEGFGITESYYSNVYYDIVSTIKKALI